MNEIGTMIQNDVELQAMLKRIAWFHHQVAFMRRAEINV